MYEQHYDVENQEFLKFYFQVKLKKKKKILILQFLNRVVQRCFSLEPRKKYEKIPSSNIRKKYFTILCSPILSTNNGFTCIYKIDRFISVNCHVNVILNIGLILFDKVKIK